MSYQSRHKKRNIILTATLVPVAVLIIVVICLIIGLTVRKNTIKKNPISSAELANLFNSKAFSYNDDIITFTIKNKVLTNNNVIKDLISPLTDFTSIVFSLAKDDKPLSSNLTLINILNFENNPTIKLKITAQKDKKFYEGFFKYNINLASYLAVYEYNEAIGQDIIYDIILQSDIKGNNPEFLLQYLIDKTKTSGNGYVTSGYDKFRILEIFEDKERIKRVNSLSDISRCYLPKVSEDEAYHDTKLVKVYYQKLLNDNSNFDFDREHNYFYCHQGDNISHLLTSLKKQLEIYQNDRVSYFSDIKWYIYFPNNNSVIKDTEVNFGKFLINQTSYLINQNQKIYTLNSQTSGQTDNKFTIYYSELYLVPEANLAKIDLVYQLPNNIYETETIPINIDSRLRDYHEGTDSFEVPHNHYHELYLDLENQIHEINEDLRLISPDREDTEFFINGEKRKFIKNTYKVLIPQLGQYQRLIITIPHPVYCANYFDDGNNLQTVSNTLEINKIKSYQYLMRRFEEWFKNTDVLPNNFGFTKDDFTLDSVRLLQPNNVLAPVTEALTIRNYFNTCRKAASDNLTGYIFLEPTENNKIIYEIVSYKDNSSFKNYIKLDHSKDYNLVDLNLDIDGYFFDDASFHAFQTDFRNNTSSLEYHKKELLIQLQYYLFDNDTMTKLPLLNDNNYNQRLHYDDEVKIIELTSEPDNFITLPNEHDFKGVENLYFSQTFLASEQVKTNFQASWDKIENLNITTPDNKTIVLTLYFKSTPLQGKLTINLFTQDRNLVSYTKVMQKTITVTASSTAISVSDYAAYKQIEQEMNGKGFLPKSGQSYTFNFNRQFPQPIVNIKFDRKVIKINFYYNSQILLQLENQLAHDTSFNDVNFNAFLEIKNRLSNQGINIDENRKVIIRNLDNLELTFAQLLDYRFQETVNIYNIEISKEA